MREENLRFMQYCAMNRKEEEEREKELERLVNDEVEKKWAQTIKQYQLERDARKKLLANVMKTREQQTEERSKWFSWTLKIRALNTTQLNPMPGAG